MKKILCIAFALGVFFSGTAYSYNEYTMRESNETEQERKDVLIGGGGGGGGGVTVTPTPAPVPVRPTPTPAPALPAPVPVPGVPEVTMATVSSCPSGTTMSSDKCCCVNN